MPSCLSLTGRPPVGRRDYAMLLLLAVYGLRGIEVVHLRLDDPDAAERPE